MRRVASSVAAGYSMSCCSAQKRHTTFDEAGGIASRSLKLTPDQERYLLNEEKDGAAMLRKQRREMKRRGVDLAELEREDEEPLEADAARVVVHGANPEENLEIESARRDSPVDAFLEEQMDLLDAAQRDENKDLPMPKAPEDLIPEFKRVKNSQKIVFVFKDDGLELEQRNQFPALPPPGEHPWVDAPIGPYIVHGDGNLGVVGTGEVGFEDKAPAKPPPKEWRGLQHTTVVGQQLPQKNGTVLQDAVVKHSLSLTGRGVFATKDIKAGDIIMIVNSSACNIGFNDELSRLCAMATELILNAYQGGQEDRDFLYNWVLNGQTSSLIHHFPKKGIERVIEDIGGQKVLDELELHPLHIARICSIIDMNSMVVESHFSERRGAAYWPEAGMLNHSCDPNATYDVMPEHMFTSSEYYQRVQGESDDADAADAEAEDIAKQEAEERAAAAAARGEAPPKDECCGCGHDHGDNGDKGLIKTAGSEVLDTEKEPEMRKVHRDDLLHAPGNYLFCCKASKDIKAGEEILISYVPVAWGYDARQMVLHDRYKFWCKCTRCSPTIDKMQARVPKLTIAMLVLFLILQLAVHRARSKTQEEEDSDLLRVVDDTITKGMVDHAALEEKLKANPPAKVVPYSTKINNY